MCETKKCNCPLCGRTFNPAKGLTAAEHLANGVILAYAQIQAKAEYWDYAATICPRCGRERMLPIVSRNAFSRHFDIYVCPECGTEEALRVFNNNILPVASWWVVSEILKRKKLC